MKRLVLSIFAVGCSMICMAQLHSVRVMAWNVENLFDCKDDSLKADEEFLPDGERAWNEGRYWKKIKDVSRVIMATGGDTPACLVGLCEVENDTVMRDLTKRSLLSTIGYQYVMTDSPDRRGIDIALMYVPEIFQLLGHESLRIPSAENNLPPTRDILHAWGILLGRDTLHVVVCHLPSKASNSKASSRNRTLALSILQHLVDSIQQKKLLVMGDFNEEKIRLNGLKDLTPKTHGRIGSYRYKGAWQWIDHIFTNWHEVTMLKTFSDEWTREEDSHGGWHPRRTYKGPAYAGGISDHLPIYSDFSVDFRE